MPPEVTLKILRVEKNLDSILSRNFSETELLPLRSDSRTSLLMISPAVVKEAMKETAKVSPGISIQYHSYANITHTLANFAAQYACLN